MTSSCRTRHALAKAGVMLETLRVLTCANKANEITRAHYEIDLDLITSQSIDMPHVMTELGMI